MAKVNMHEAEQHISNLQHMLQRIQTDPIVHPTLQHAAEDFLKSGIAQTLREMKKSRRSGRLSFEILWKKIVKKILPHDRRAVKWQKILLEDEGA